MGDSVNFLPRVPKSPLRNQGDDMSDGGFNEDPVSLGESPTFPPNGSSCVYVGVCSGWDDILYHDPFLFMPGLPSAFPTVSPLSTPPTGTTQDVSRVSHVRSRGSSSLKAFAFGRAA